MIIKYVILIRIIMAFRITEIATDRAREKKINKFESNRFSGLPWLRCCLLFLLFSFRCTLYCSSILFELIIHFYCRCCSDCSFFFLSSFCISLSPLQWAVRSVSHCSLFSLGQVQPIKRKIFRDLRAFQMSIFSHRCDSLKGTV